MILHVIHICWYAVAIAASDEGHGRFNCVLGEQCQDLSGERLTFCCGDCQQSFCCNNTSMKMNESLCATPGDLTDEKGWDSSAKMLGVIIGGMVASFAGAMIAHTLIQRCVMKLRNRRNLAQNQAAIDVGEICISTTNASLCNTLPSYEDLYKKERDSKETENFAFAITSPSEEVVGEAQSVASSDTDEPPPPAYSTLFMQIEGYSR